MSLEGLAVVAELVGALGVIASLLYLAAQVRQAQAVARAESIREVQDSFRRFTRAMYEDHEAASIFRVGCNDRSALTPIQQTRFDFMISDQILSLIDLEAAHRGGLFDTDLYDRWLAWVAAILNAPGAAEWWTWGQFLYKENVVALLNEARLSAPSVTELPGLAPLSSAAPGANLDGGLTAG